MEGRIGSQTEKRQNEIKELQIDKQRRTNRDGQIDRRTETDKLKDIKTKDENVMKPKGYEKDGQTER
jgi:hypothetical protein